MATAALPRGPKGHFLTGNLPELRRDRLGTFTRFAREYGDFVPYRLGIQRAILVSHPDLIEAILVTHNRSFMKTPSLRNSRRLLGNGLLSSEGDFWRRQRRLAQPAFSRERLAGYGETMLDFTERALEGWTDGQVRDVHADMMRLTLEIVVRSLFGSDVGNVADQVGEMIEVALARFTTRIETMQFLVPDTLPLPGNLHFLRTADRLDRIVLGIVERRRREGGGGTDLLSLLLSAQDEDGSRMTDQQLRDEAMTIFLAGHETTAIALSWTWYLLSQHPEVERKLIAEQAEVLGGRAPTVADLPRLRYAEHVASEALRLYPPVWTISRQATAPCEIGGYHVEKGQILRMVQWVVHRDPRFWDRPDEFVPERWAEPPAGRPRFAYFPFAGGPRICIGASFAMMEAVLIMTAILRRFHLALEPNQRIVPWASATLRPRYGVRVRLERREPDADATRAADQANPQ